MTVTRFEIVPHVGIGPVKLGMTVAEAERALANCRAAQSGRHSQKPLAYFFDNALQFELGKSDRIQFIGLSCHKAILATFDGKDVFDLPATELFELIAAHDSSSKHVFDPSEYLFENLIMTVWEADEQYDRKGRQARAVYAQVGLGNEEYLAARREIKARRQARRRARTSTPIPNPFLK
jgi:hypothetical protein